MELIIGIPTMIPANDRKGSYLSNPTAETVKLNDLRTIMRFDRFPAVSFDEVSPKTPMTVLNTEQIRRLPQRSPRSGE